MVNNRTAARRETLQDAPPGARVVNPEGVEQPRAERPATERRGSDTWNATMNTLLGLGIPVGLLFGGLLFMWYQASQEGLYEVLKTLKLKRDRSQKRKGAPAHTATPIPTHPCPHHPCPAAAARKRRPSHATPAELGPSRGWRVGRSRVARTHGSHYVARARAAAAAAPQARRLARPSGTNSSCRRTARVAAQPTPEERI